MKSYLTCETKTDGIMFDITGSKFIVFVKEYLGTDSEGYADIIYFKLPLKCEEIPTSILFEQISEMASTINRSQERANKDKELIKKLTELNETLLSVQQDFEKQFYDRAAALFNAKKKFIQENIANKVSKLNNSHDVSISEELMSKSKKLEEKLYSSPSRSPNKRVSSTKVNTTPKRTPTKSTKRTPSKLLLRLQDMSDSDDSFTVLSSTTNKNSLHKTASESLDSSRVFKNFKIKTPIKQKDEKRESSVELKIEKNTNKINSDDSESEHKPLKSKTSKGSNQQNDQQIEVDDHDIKSKPIFAFDDSQPLFDDDLSQPLLEDDPSQSALNNTVINEDEEIPCSQDSQVMVTSYTERLRLRSQNKAKKQKIDNSTSINPYDVDTVNILNMSD